MTNRCRLKCWILICSVLLLGVSEKLCLYRKYKNRKRVDLPPCWSPKKMIITPMFCLGFCIFKRQERQNDQNGTIGAIAGTIGAIASAIGMIGNAQWAKRVQ